MLHMQVGGAGWVGPGRGGGRGWGVAGGQRHAGVWSGPAHPAHAGKPLAQPVEEGAAAGGSALAAAAAAERPPPRSPLLPTITPLSVQWRGLHQGSPYLEDYYYQVRC